MRLTSHFNTIKALIQTNRHENMAYLQGNKPSINSVVKDEVEIIPNMQQYAGGTRNITRVLRAILEGKGRVEVPIMVTTEDGGVLPLGIDPAKNIKDLDPIINHKINLVSTAEARSLQDSRVVQKIENERADKIEATRRELMNLNKGAADAKKAQQADLMNLNKEPEKSQKEILAEIMQLNNIETGTINAVRERELEQYTKQMEMAAGIEIEMPVENVQVEGVPASVRDEPRALTAEEKRLLTKGTDAERAKLKRKAQQAAAKAKPTSKPVRKPIRKVTRKPVQPKPAKSTITGKTAPAPAGLKTSLTGYKTRPVTKGWSKRIDSKPSTQVNKSSNDIPKFRMPTKSAPTGGGFDMRI